mgnify:CR=1 FL=1
MGLRRGASFASMKLVEGARIRISGVLNEGRSESVDLVNEGHAAQPMTGWALASFRGTRIFRFEDGFVLGPGKRVRITSGEGVHHSPPGVLGWTDETVWNNRGDVALLFDCDGEEVVRFVYPKAKTDRLPRHVLVAGEDGTGKIQAVRRIPARARSKVTRTGRSRA